MPKFRATPDGASLSSRSLRRLPFVFCIVALTLVLTVVMREQLISALAWLSGRFPIATNNPQSVLTFSSTNQFKIAIFEDLHFGEDEFSDWAPRADAATLNVMSSILNNEQPQLAVLNGDLISGDNTYLSNSTDYLDMLVSPLVAHKTPWASTYGNHDHNFNLSVSALLARERTYSLSHTHQMVFHPDAGVSNYYVPIYPPSPGPDTPPALVLYCKSDHHPATYPNPSLQNPLHLTPTPSPTPNNPHTVFDSRGGHAFQRLNYTTDPPTLLPLPATIHPSVTSWFLSTSTALAAQHNLTSIPSLAFVHIPTTLLSTFSHHNATTNTTGPSPTHEPGFADEPHFIPQSDDLAFVDALLRVPGMTAVFSGHQHGNDWCMGTRKRAASPIENEGQQETQTQTHTAQQKQEQRQEPFFACFGRHTGYGGYGSWERGARVVSVGLRTLGAGGDNDDRGDDENDDVGIETWIRLERGGVSGHVVLNESYGEDVYGKIERTFTHLDDLREGAEGEGEDGS